MTAVFHVQCPSCDEIVPVGVMPPQVDDDGNIDLEPDLSDVWAHAWTHDEETSR